MTQISTLIVRDFLQSHTRSHIAGRTRFATPFCIGNFSIISRDTETVSITHESRILARISPSCCEMRADEIGGITQYIDTHESRDDMIPTTRAIVDFAQHCAESEEWRARIIDRANGQICARNLCVSNIMDDVVVSRDIISENALFEEGLVVQNCAEYALPPASESRGQIITLIPPLDSDMRISDDGIARFILTTRITRVFSNGICWYILD
ncbi:MAG: hypothetical protein WC887_03205 [Candidatus Paceibacterota bacterium]|jgi:hypothetical protein